MRAFAALDVQGETRAFFAHDGMARRGKHALFLLRDGRDVVARLAAGDGYFALFAAREGVNDIRPLIEETLNEQRKFGRVDMIYASPDYSVEGCLTRAGDHYERLLKAAGGYVCETYRSYRLDLDCFKVDYARVAARYGLTLSPIFAHGLRRAAEAISSCSRFTHEGDADYEGVARRIDRLKRDIDFDASFIAYHNERPVGFIIVKKGRPQRVMTLAVTVEFVNRGAAYALCGASASVMRDACPWCEVGVIREGNARPENMILRLGGIRRDKFVRFAFRTDC